MTSKPPEKVRVPVTYLSKCQCLIHLALHHTFSLRPMLMTCVVCVVFHSIRSHLIDVGLDGDIAEYNELKGLSGGQKVKVVIASVLQV